MTQQQEEVRSQYIKFNKQRNMARGLTAVCFLAVLLSLLIPNEDLQTAIFLIALVGVWASIAWGVNATTKIPNQVNADAYDFVYVFRRKKFISTGSIILNVVSLIWFFISSIQDKGVEMALALFIGFGLLSAFELVLKTFKNDEFSGFTFAYNKSGVTITRGTWTRALPWGRYKAFGTVYHARFGKIISYIPYLSMFISESDKYTLNLYRSEAYLQSLRKNPVPEKSSSVLYDRIVAMPDNFEKVTAYISRYLPEQVKDLTLSQRI